MQRFAANKPKAADPDIALAKAEGTKVRDKQIGPTIGVLVNIFVGSFLMISLSQIFLAWRLQSGSGLTYRPANTPLHWSQG